jgi:steroid delta-isomerase
VSPQMQRIVKWYENLSPITLSSIDTIYDDEVFFKDPFNEIVGIENLKSVFEKMFEQLPMAKFYILDVVEEEDVAFMNWQMSFKAFGKDQIIHGVSHLKFFGNKLNYHRDYWDSSEELFEKIPVVGPVFNLTRKVF